MQPSKKAIISGYVVQALNVGYGLLLLPFMLVLLSPNEVAFWLIMLSFLGLVIVFDFGFSPAVTRNVAYVMTGATKLTAHGVEQISTLEQQTYRPNWELFNQLFQTVKKLYGFISLIGLVVFGLFGTWYVIQFLDKNPVENGLDAWFIFLTGFILNLYFLYTSPVLMGIGKFVQANMINIVMRVVWLVFSSIGLILFESILVLPISYLIGVVLARIYAYFSLNKHIVKTFYEKSSLLKILMPNAWRLGVVSFGAFLINKATIFFAGIYFSAEVAAPYMVTLQVLAVMMAFSTVYFQLHVPQLSSMQIVANLPKKKLYYRLITISLGIYLGMALFVAVAGEFILEVIGSNVGLLSGLLLLMVFVFGFLELNHSLAATYLTTLNQVPFFWAAITSGIAIVVIILILFSVVGLDELIWLIVIQGGVQLMYNNWKWPHMVYTILKNEKVYD